MARASDADDEVQALRLQLAAAEAKARKLEHWLDELFDRSTTGLGVISALENRYVRANPVLAELYDISVEELLSIDPFSLAIRVTHPDELEREQKLFAEVVTGARRFYQIDKRLMRRDGSHRLGRLTLSGLYAEPVEPEATVGPLCYMVLQFVDLSEQQALKEALTRREAELRHAQKIDGIGRLAAGIAHDFNNLLTVIIGHGEVLKSVLAERGAHEKPEPQPDLDAILSASERAAALTAQLLSHGRRSTALPRTFVLSEVVGTLQQLLVRVIGSNIEVEQSLAASGAIHADPGQIGQVVMNLMLNARDAISDVGRIRLATADVTVNADGAQSPPGPGQWVTLAVSDSGHGMSAEVQARMFEPFFTTRPDRPGTQGTGLGLATVQRIVAEVGGQIHVASTLGEGTTLTVFFPRVASTPKPTEVSPQNRPALAPNSRRVLVVEDEPSVRSLIGNVLLGAHYLVRVARNGQEALRFIESEPEPFHLIVTDLMMPSVGGATLAKTLLEHANRPRMLFISGYSHHTAEDLLPYGHFLPKPFTPAQLLTAVLAALD